MNAVHEISLEVTAVKEYLYQVGIRDNKTGEKLNLRVWAKNVEEATHKLTGRVLGYGTEYAWTGSGPLYENNKIIEREVED